MLRFSIVYQVGLYTKFYRSSDLLIIWLTNKLVQNRCGENAENLALKSRLQRLSWENIFYWRVPEQNLNMDTYNWQIASSDNLDRIGPTLESFVCENWSFQFVEFTILKRSLSAIIINEVIERRLQRNRADGKQVEHIKVTNLQITTLSASQDSKILGEKTGFNRCHLARLW